MGHTWTVTPWPAGDRVSITIADDDTGEWATVVINADAAEEIADTIREGARQAREWSQL